MSSDKWGIRFGASPDRKPANQNAESFPDDVRRRIGDVSALVKEVGECIEERLIDGCADPVAAAALRALEGIRRETERRVGILQAERNEPPSMEELDTLYADLEQAFVGAEAYFD